MKANELMIGDWVLINGTPRKIQAVDGVDDEIMADDELYTLAEDRYHSEDKVEGMPITPEILEKNGFTSYGEAWYLPENKATGNEKILVGFYMYETHISVRNGSKCFDNRVPCEYRACAANRHVFVHELQHALRQCGIEKEITI